jgi:hypothetical protein
LIHASTQQTSLVRLDAAATAAVTVAVAVAVAAAAAVAVAVAVAVAAAALPGRERAPSCRMHCPTITSTRTAANVTPINTARGRTTKAGTHHHQVRKGVLAQDRAVGGIGRRVVAAVAGGCCGVRDRVFREQQAQGLQLRHPARAQQQPQQ